MIKSEYYHFEDLDDLGMINNSCQPHKMRAIWHVPLMEEHITDYGVFACVCVCVCIKSNLWLIKSLHLTTKLKEI